RAQLTEQYVDELYEESDGHPYVVKMLLAEVTRAKRVGAIERVLARRDEVLDALFERTFQSLTPAAQRVFLTLCNWRSVAPRLVVEAVLMRPSNERMDVVAAIDELERNSLVEGIGTEDGSQDFLSVPLAAAVFGRRKLVVSPAKAAIDADTRLIRL